VIKVTPWLPKFSLELLYVESDAIVLTGFLKGCWEHEQESSFFRSSPCQKTIKFIVIKFFYYSILIVAFVGMGGLLVV
jgi:nitrate reductase NapE component